MSEHLAQVASMLGAPEYLIERSAQAKAGATGQSVEDILAVWAGGEEVSATVPPTTEPESSTTEAETEAEPTTVAPTPAVETGTPEPSEAETEELAELTSPPITPAPAPVPPKPPSPDLIPAPAPVPVASTTSPAPVAPPPPPAHEVEEVDSSQAWQFPVVVTVPTSDLKEKTTTGIPRWLSMLLLTIPLFGLIYLAAAAETEECLDTGFEISVDRITGEGVNCDGSPFTGRSTGEGGQNFIALGERLYRGDEIPSVNCATCHGNNGQGGVGPEMGSVIAAFGSCQDHEKWVGIGSGDWPDSTYSDLAKSVEGGMPGFVDSLSPEQLKSVVAFERVRFGGGEVEEVLTDCGLLEAEDDEDAGSNESETEPPEEAAEGTTTEVALG